jgi:hypothetical protein
VEDSIMKKIISKILCFVMLISIILPGNVSTVYASDVATESDESDVQVTEEEKT